MISLIILTRQMPNINVKKFPGLIPTLEVCPSAIQDLEKTIDSHVHLSESDLCLCSLCRDQRFSSTLPKEQKLYSSTGELTSTWLKKVLDGLTTRGVKTPKIFLPDILFVQADTLQIYQSTRKQGRICKLAGSSPLKTVYSTFLKLRSEYKEILERKFNDELLKKLDPQFVHQKYFDKLIPSHFNEGVDSPALEKNKNTFVRYVLHQNPNYQLQKIEEHKMNEKEPFCIVKYNDGNCTLFNQLQLEIYCLEGQAKLQQEVCYFQSYIKYKLQAESIYYSQYLYSDINDQIYLLAERQVLVLIGGINKYDQQYRDLEVYEQAENELMLRSPKEYIDLMTYKIVHFLSMVSRIYVSHLRLKWIMNDVKAVYLQEVMQLETTELPRRPAKFKLPPQQQRLDFYSSNQDFIDIYKDMNRRKAINTQIIKQQMSNKTYSEILELMEPQSKLDLMQTAKSKINKLETIIKPKSTLENLSRTIDHTSPLNNLSSRLASGNQAGRYSNLSAFDQRTKVGQQIMPLRKRVQASSLDRSVKVPKIDKSQFVDNQINHHFVYRVPNSPTVDKNRGAFDQPPTILSQYLVKKNQKISESILGNTLMNLHKQRIKNLSEKLNNQKIYTKMPYLQSLK